MKQFDRSWFPRVAVVAKPKARVAQKYGKKTAGLKSWGISENYNRSTLDVIGSFPAVLQKVVGYASLGAIRPPTSVAERQEARRSQVRHPEVHHALALHSVACPRTDSCVEILLVDPQRNLHHELNRSALEEQRRSAKQSWARLSAIHCPHGMTRVDLDETTGKDELAERIGDMRAAGEDATTRLTRSVAKARIANALFASEHRVDIGRYRLLEQAGRGGMGVVWSAWDPELERRVAIKLVRATVKSARDQIQREGQALAKLSHPNVVPIYDVGVIDDQVYLVMEWVRGATLRELCQGEHSTQEIVQVYRQVCAGLGAAHRAGVIHRDFKPENAIRGEDGRVRVLDFGLAVGEAAAGGIAGTPRYMAPEQAAGLVITAAVDQYACCTSLREALHGVGGRSVPGWLDAIVSRGTETDPASRFPTMDALAAALDNDPFRRWRRRGVVVATASGIALAFAIGRARSTEPPGSRCRDAGNQILTIWNPAARQTLTDHMHTLGEFGTHEAPRLVDELTHYATAWSEARADACLAHNQGMIPEALYEQRLRCLSRSEAAFTTAIEIATEVTADKLENALIAARSLPSAAGCAAEDALAVPPPPQAVAARVTEVAAAVERSRMLALAASPRAIEVATSAAVAAAETRYIPLVARATMVQGWAHALADSGFAWELLDQAFHEALRVGDDVLAVEAYARAWFVASREEDFEPADRERQLVEDVAVRTGPSGRFARALLYNNLAAGQIVSNDLAGAKHLLRQALEAWRPPLGDRAQDIELTAVLLNLALVEDEPARRVELSQRALDSQQSQLGPEHPDTIKARIQLALFTPDPVRSARLVAQTCSAIPDWHSQLRAQCAYQEGLLAIERSDAGAARAAMAIAHANGEPQQAGIARAYADVISANRARITAARNAMYKLARELSTAADWWIQRDGASAWMMVALSEGALGRDAESIRAWQNALAALKDLPVLERRRAFVQATLARRLAETSPGRARSYAEAAIRWYRKAGGYDREIAELARIFGE